MTLDQAIAEARRMQAAADANWPEGYQYTRVLLRAMKCLRVFEAAAATPEKARELVEQLDDVEVAW